MPRYNGPIAYLIEVLAHLVWCHVLFGLVYIVMALPLIVSAALSGAAVPGLQAFVSLISGAPVFFLFCVQFLILGAFPWSVQPRFAYAPVWLNIIVASVFASLTLTAVWSLDQTQFDGDLLLSRFASFTALAVTIVLIGYGLRHLGAVSPGVGNPGRWFGRLLVGRDVYDTFVASEETRLRRDYESYRDSLRT